MMATASNESILAPAVNDSYETNSTGRDSANDDGGNPFIMSWYLQFFYIFIFVAMVLVASGGNSIVIWIVLAHKRMRTVTNYFLVNLAVADLLITLLNTLFNFVYMLNSDWPFGRYYCKFSMFVSTCSISCSVFTFMAIAIDRYIAIIHPLKPRMRAPTVLGLILVIWVASSLVALPNLLYAVTFTRDYGNGSSRTMCYIEWPAHVDFWYNLFLIFVNYMVPLGALTLTYARVGLELWGSRTIGEYCVAQIETIKSKRRVVKMMVVVVVIFGVCWLPQHVFFIASNVCASIKMYKHTQHIYLAIFWLAMSNSMYNPIIYCWMNNKFREGFKFVFRWLPCVTNSYSSNALFGPPTCRAATSMSETTKYTLARNGSTMTSVDASDSLQSRGYLIENEKKSAEAML